MSRLIPDGWNRYEIKDTALPSDRHSFTGGPFGSNLKSEDYTSNGVRIIQLQNIGDGFFKNSYKIYTSKEKADELLSCNIYPNDIILSKMGDPVARATIIPDMSTRYLMASDGIRLAIDKSRFDTSFILNTINSAPFRSQAEISSTGSTRKRIGLTELRRLVFIAPTLPEQQKIAAILSSVDDVIEKTQAQIDKLKDLKTGVMQELLTKGIGENGKPHTEFKDSPVGRIPVGWEVRQLSDVGQIQTGAAKNSKTVGDLIEVPYLRVANVQDGYLDLRVIKHIKIDRSRIDRFLLQDEDVLVNEGGDLDKLGRGFIWRNQISPCIHQNHVFVVRTNKSYLLPPFFNYLSGSEHGKKYYLGCAKQTTNLASINSSQLKKFPVIIPPLNEQRRICQVLCALDEKINLTTKQREHKISIKKALMQDLLTGKVRVNVESEHA